jgi:P-type conjugative transfer protein TrbJ
MARDQGQGEGTTMRLLLWISVFFAIFPLNVRAQDVATEHTQLLNNIELITENLRQLQSLENQILMIKNQVEELKSVANFQNNFTDIDALRNNLTNITNQGTALSNQTQTILTQMQQELTHLPASGTMIDQQESLDQGTLNIVQNALNRAAQVRQSYQQVVNSVNALMDKNNLSVGQTQALQTSNELAAQNIAQTQSTQELLSEQISMQAAMMSKQLQEEQDEDNKMKQIFNAADDGSSIFGPLN